LRAVERAGVVAGGFNVVEWGEVKEFLNKIEHIAILIVQPHVTD
jgi:hypothetical protein